MRRRGTKLHLRWRYVVVVGHLDRNAEKGFVEKGFVERTVLRELACFCHAAGTGRLSQCWHWKAFPMTLASRKWAASLIAPTNTRGPSCDALTSCSSGAIHSLKPPALCSEVQPDAAPSSNQQTPFPTVAGQLELGRWPASPSKKKCRQCSIPRRLSAFSKQKRC